MRLLRTWKSDALHRGPALGVLALLVAAGTVAAGCGGGTTTSTETTTATTTVNQSTTESTTQTGTTSAGSGDFEGPILSVDAGQSTFEVNAHEQGTFTIEVSASTTYEELSGFDALQPGLIVDVHASQSNGRWIASKIEPGS